MTDNTIPTALLPFLWRYLSKNKLYLIGLFFVTIIWAIELSLSPYLLKIIIDIVAKYPHEAAKFMASILLPAGGYIALSIITNLSYQLSYYINLKLYPKIKTDIFHDLFLYVHDHSYSFFQNNFTGNITKKITDLAVVEILIKIFNEEFYLRIFALAIASSTLFTTVRPIFGVVLIGWTILFIGFSYWSAKRTEKFSKKFAKDVASMSGSMADSIANAVNVKLFANAQAEGLALKQDLNQVIDSDTNLQFNNLRTRFVHGLGINSLSAIMLIMLIYDYMHGLISVGDFALVLTLSFSFAISVRHTGEGMQMFSSLAGVCREALDTILTPYEVADVVNAQPIKITTGKITFEQVMFAYHEQKPLFNNLSVVIKPGEKVGLVGYSGGGKSTFIKLILRLFDLQDGNIIIDGQDIKKITQESLRKQIGIIPQETELLHRTIMENIRFARVDASDAEVIAAAKQAKCHEFICSLPQGYQSLVGERGIKLSGGQRQRIAIARAVLKNAPILILDEATSALDSITERDIQAGLINVMTQKTTLVIAHRLATLKHMDRILVFVRGKIVEDGSIEALLKNKTGHFYQLWHMQSAGFIKDPENEV